MRYVNMARIEPGMRLGRALYDNESRVLLAAYSTLTPELLYRIKSLGFIGLYIDDEISRGIEPKETIPDTLRNKGIQALRHGNIDAGLSVSKDIVAHILEADNISLDLIDLRNADDYTYRHSINVCVISTIIGMKLNLNYNDLKDLSIAAIFHDLGKLMIDPQILNKPSRLTEEEFNAIKKHPNLSYKTMSSNPLISSASKVGALYHHENENGSGYPEGLEGNEIHLFAKIIHVADVYDALTSNRAYKKPYALSEAIEYIMGGCDILFDKTIVETFLKSVPVYPKGYTVILSNNSEAIIVENTTNPLRPIIRTYSGVNIDLNSDLKYQNVIISPSTSVETDFSSELSALAKGSIVKKPRILVVDDMLTILQQIRSILNKHYSVFMVKSGKQAIEFIANNGAPDIILMDIDLPGIDGVETIELINKKFSNKIPVIFITSISDKATVLRCKNLHAKDYIVKPIKPAYILERLRMVLEDTYDI